MSSADRMIPAIAEEWLRLRQADTASLPDALRVARDRADVREVIERLGRWDRQADTASVETTWFVLANERRQIGARKPENRAWPWSFALIEMLDLLQQQWSGIDVAWGMINRLQRPLPGASVTLDSTRTSLAVGGAPGGLGSVFTFHSEPFGGVSPRIGVSGNSFVKVVEFGPTIRARSILNFGQSGDPHSPHFFDQAALYAKRTFKDAWFSEQDVKAKAVRSYVVKAPRR